MKPREGDDADEQGVVLPLVALMMSVLLGMAALVIDLGNARRVEQALQSATDAAAMAAAYDFAIGAANPCGSADTYLALNQPSAARTLCASTINGPHGYVTVQARENTNAAFAPILGAGDITVGTSTTAIWGPPVAWTRLRSLPICYEASPRLKAAVDSPPTSPQPPIRINFKKTDPSTCGTDAAGNWGHLHLDRQGDHHTAEFMEHGYDEPIWIDAANATSCVGGGASCVDGSFGPVWSTGRFGHDALVDVKNSDDYVLLPVFDYAEQVQPGRLNREFHIISALRAKILEFQIDGAAGDFIRLEVQPGPVSGLCCGPIDKSAGNSVIAVCAIDPADVRACLP